MKNIKDLNPLRFSEEIPIITPWAKRLGAKVQAALQEDSDD